MKTLFCIVVSLTAATASYSQFIQASFPTTYWFADAVVVGAVVKVNDETFDFQVREWMRARDCDSPKVIRAKRYAVPTDVGPWDPVPLSAGSKYLLLLRKPYDQGAGDSPNWLVLKQIDLAGSSFCLRGADGLFESKEQLGCQQPIARLQLLDATRSFDKCFVLYDDPIKGTYPSSTKCSDKTIHTWAGRSALHAELATAALRSIERRSPR